MVDVMVVVMGGNIVMFEVCGLMGEKVNVFYGFIGDGKMVVIEMVVVSGLMLVVFEKCNLLLVFSFGMGELICYVLDNGICYIIFGIGGSVMVDGGMGMV